MAIKPDKIQISNLLQSWFIKLKSYKSLFLRQKNNKKQFHCNKVHFKGSNLSEKASIIYDHAFWSSLK